MQTSGKENSRKAEGGRGKWEPCGVLGRTPGSGKGEVGTMHTSGKKNSRKGEVGAMQTSGKENSRKKEGQVFKEQRGQVVQSIIGPGDDLSFYPEHEGEPMEGLKQRSHMA